MRLRGIALVLSLLVCSCGGGGGGGNSEPPSATQFYPPGAAIPVSGPDVPGAAGFDQGVMALMRKWNVPGVAVGVTRGGQLILARAYGYADFEARQAMQPATMTRVASVSKTLTAIAILHLRDQGLLDLDRPFMSILTEYQVATGGDARLPTITLRQLLQHSGGWDKQEGSTDFLAEPTTVASALGIATPVKCPDTIRYSMTQPLDFAPGTRWAYSSFGYCILSEVIARIAGESYENYVRDAVLTPASVYAMSLGFPQLNQRGPYEAKYYVDNGTPTPYAGNLASGQGAYAWLGSAVDLMRIMSALDGSRIPSLISADSMAQMLANPSTPGFIDHSAANATWYGLGLFVGPTDQSYGHGGLGRGSQTLLWRAASGYAFAILTNSRASDPAAFASDLYATVTAAIGSGFLGSSIDLYPQFPSPALPASGQ